MTITDQAPFSAAVDRDLRPLLRSARSTWRRAGVLPVDQRRLSDELHAELVAAAEFGGSPATVLGETPAVTLQQWAHEQGVSGRSVRIGVLVPLTLLSVLIGSMVLIADQIVESVVPGAPFITHGAIWLSVLVSSIAVSWALPPLTCWAALHRGGDPRATATARWLFALLPAGAGAALIVDIIIAMVSGADGPFIPVMAVATAAVFAVTPVMARHLATRHTRSGR